MPPSEVAAIVAIVSFGGVILAGLGGVLWRVWRLEFRVETMWKYLTTDPPATKRRGRRRTDLPVLYSSADDKPRPEKP